MHSGPVLVVIQTRGLGALLRSFAVVGRGKWRWGVGYVFLNLRGGAVPV